MAPNPEKHTEIDGLNLQQLWPEGATWWVCSCGYTFEWFLWRWFLRRGLQTCTELWEIFQFVQYSWLLTGWSRELVCAFVNSRFCTKSFPDLSKNVGSNIFQQCFERSPEIGLRHLRYMSFSYKLLSWLSKNLQLPKVQRVKTNVSPVFVQSLSGIASVDIGFTHEFSGVYVQSCSKHLLEIFQTDAFRDMLRFNVRTMRF